MVRSKIFVALVLLVVIQSTLVQSWWWRRRRRSCRYPKPSQGNKGTYSDYFYGDTSLWKDKGKRTIVSTRKLRHSLLLFRGVIFEWGIKPSFWASRTYKMNRSLNDCSITWKGRKGQSKCHLSDVQNWTRRYKGRYGGYALFSNNCHHFVNRLGHLLDSNCGH